MPVLSSRIQSRAHDGASGPVHDMENPELENSGWATTDSPKAHDSSISRSDLILQFGTGLWLPLSWPLFHPRQLIRYSGGGKKFAGISAMSGAVPKGTGENS